MLWFFAFTTIGIAIFALFLALKSMARVPLLQIFTGSALMALTGFLAIKASPFAKIRPI